ncbi:MAG TPA: hypothetical protein VH724_00540 [Candidatus Angelobacter sp.]|nr:hypothetical protein [Candidatus Angelobacter sp.]
MFRYALTILFLLAAACMAQQAQAPAPQQTPVPQPAPSPQPPASKPQVKVNYLNVCTPGADEQAVINGALKAVEPKPAFSTDFEISRGRTTLKDAPDARYVRLRRDFAPESPLLTAQYSMSTDATNTIEILVLRPRDAKDFLEVVMENRVTANAAAPLAVLQVDTPTSRVRIERLNKSSAVLARCQDVDQSAYDPMFRQASDIMAQYRAALGLRTAFRSDIAWLNPSPSKAAGAPKSKTKDANKATKR